MADEQVYVQVIDDFIVCSPVGGNLRIAKNGKVKWKKKGLPPDVECQLSFVDYGTGRAAWPFESPAPVDGNRTGWLKASFDATAVTEGQYKYTVEVRGTAATVLPYDPVIIVKP